MGAHFPNEKGRRAFEFESSVERKIGHDGVASGAFAQTHIEFVAVDMRALGDE